jgi:N-acetylmuramoyl-L-alanine amidase
MKRLYRFAMLSVLLAALVMTAFSTRSVAAAALVPAMTEAPAASLAYTSATALVTTGALNVRSGPGSNFNRVAVIYQGHVVTLLGRNSNASWAQIRTAAGQTGWVNVSFIQPGVAISTLPVTDSHTPAPAASAIVATGALNVRSGPGVGYSIVAVVGHGDVVTLLGRNATASWVQVQRASGQTGWVNASLVQPTVAISTLPLVETPAGTAVPLATVVTGALNVRTGPGVGYSIISTLQNGQQAPLLGRNSDSSWTQIRLATGQVGWVRTAFIQTPVAISSLPLVSIAGTAPAATATVTTWALNVRSGPGVSYGIVTAVQQGQQVTLLGRNSAATWVQVRLAGGQTGWLNAYFIQSSVGIASLPITG